MKLSPLERDRRAFDRKVAAAMDTLETLNASLTSRESLDAEMVNKIVAAFKGNGEVFMEIDAREWRRPWFWAVRTIRNSPTFGPKLFDSFK